MRKKSYLKIFSLMKITINKHHYISHNTLMLVGFQRDEKVCVFDMNLSVMPLSKNCTGDKIPWPIVSGKGHVTHKVKYCF